MRQRKTFLVFSKPRFEEDEIQEIVNTLRSGWVGTGPKAAQFEKEFAAYVGAPHAIAVNSCTAALHLAYQSLDLSDGDEVIVPAMTFGATANAVIHAGGRPVFVDIDPQTLCIAPAAVSKAITSRTKAVVVVHFAGRMGPIDELLKICSEHKIELIEDCAHAIESTWKGKHAGTFGRAGCFSFYATKNVSTGEGGMFITHDGALAERIRKLALHGMSKDAHKRFSASGYTHYSFDEVGFKYNMPDLSASLGLHQLRRIEKNRQHRIKIWNLYERGLAPLRAKGVGLPEMPSPSNAEVHALHLFQIRIPRGQRDAFLQAFAQHKIGVGVHYQALTDHELYKPYLTDSQRQNTALAFPHSHRFGAETISLPLGTDMTEEDALDVVDAALHIAERLLD